MNLEALLHRLFYIDCIVIVIINIIINDSDYYKLWLYILRSDEIYFCFFKTLIF